MILIGKNLSTVQVSAAVATSFDTAIPAVPVAGSANEALDAVASIVADRATPVMTRVERTSVNNAGDSTKTDVVNVNGKGILSGIFQHLRMNSAQGLTSSHIVIILDGTTIYDSIFIEQGYSTATDYLASIPLNFRFGTSLRVQHAFAGQVNNASIRTIVSYTTT